jgi:hypothetical protein
LIPQLISYFLAKNLDIPVNELTTYAVIGGVTIGGVAIWKFRSQEATVAKA